MYQSFVPLTPDANWVAKHVRQTRCTLQIVKCQNQKCCEPFKTNWLDVFPDCFVPFPAVYKYESNGSVAVEPSEYIKNPRKYEFSPLTKRLLLKKSPDEAKAYVEVPFEIYCLSMKEKLEKGISPICNSYWPSTAAMLRHKKCHTVRNHAKIEEDDDIEIEDNEIEIDDSSDEVDNEVDNEKASADAMPIFDNIFDILAFPFIEEE